MKVAEARIVGAMAAPRGKAAFDRAPLVLESVVSPGNYLQVRAYVGSDEVEGKALGQEEWDALVRSEQAIRLGPMKAAAGAALWVLRPSFEGREAALEELRMAGGLVHDKEVGADGSFLCVVREPEANGFRDGWARKAADVARSWAREGQWERALTAATRAFVLERAMSPEMLAMLSLAHERSGNHERAEGYLAMARRSRGATFEAEVREKRGAIERECGERASESHVRPRFAQAIHQQNGRAMLAGLQGIRRPSKAAA